MECANASVVDRLSIGRRYKTDTICQDDIRQPVLMKIIARPQCVSCNIFNQGNAQMYRRGLIDQIGEQRVDMVEYRAKNTSSIIRISSIRN